jgi:hypothetical protein
MFEHTRGVGWTVIRPSKVYSDGYPSEKRGPITHQDPRKTLLSTENQLEPLLNRRIANRFLINQSKSQSGSIRVDVKRVNLIFFHPTPRSEFVGRLFRRARLIDLGAHFTMHGAHSLLHP